MDKATEPQPAETRAAPGRSTLIAALWQNQPESRLKRSFKRGLGPVAIGLVFAGALAIIQAGPMTPITLLNTLICIGILYFTKFSPYKLVGVVALVFFGLNFGGT